MNLIAYLKYETANHTNCLEQVGIQMKIFPIFEHVKEMLNKKVNFAKNVLYIFRKIQVSYFCRTGRDLEKKPELEILNEI